MKQVLFFIIILMLFVLLVPCLFDTVPVPFLGLDITTWIGGIGVIVLGSLALFLSKEDIKSNKKKKVIKKKK